jgi:VWFA-related protein
MKSPRKIIAFAMLPTMTLAISLLRAQNPTPPAQNPPAQNPPPATPANPPAKTPQAPKIIAIVKTVVVPVTVKDRNGNLVADLKKDDFRLFEDKVEQQIDRVITEAYPLSMVILIDNDLGLKDQEQVEPSLVSIVGGMASADEAFICRFDQYFHEGKGFTSDQDKLVTQLRRTELASRSSTPPSGDPFSGPTINNAPAPGVPPFDTQSLRSIKGQPTKALDDAVYASAMLLKGRDSLKRRKVILLISDGQNGAKFNTHKYDEVKAELLNQTITLYAVATGSQYFNRKFTRLSEYTHDTGGDIFYGAKSDTFSEFYSRITEEARNQYTLIYSPRGESNEPYHPIEVRVRRDGLTILAREGYYSGFEGEVKK